MIWSPVIIQAAQTFFRCSLLTVHERQDTGTLTHGSGVFSSIPLIQMGCKKSDSGFAAIPSNAPRTTAPPDSHRLSLSRRLAAEGMQFPWRWNGDTISLSLGVI
jgi:hypothetical protein